MRADEFTLFAEEESSSPTKANEKLFAKIGKLEMKNEWLKKKL